MSDECRIYDGPFVYRTGRRLFKPERRVQFSHGLLNMTKWRNWETHDAQNVAPQVVALRSYDRLNRIMLVQVQPSALMVRPDGVADRTGLS